MNDRPTAPFMDVSRQEAAIITLCMLPMYFGIGALARDGRGAVAGIAATCMAVSIRFAWPLHKQLWFWCTIGAIALLHALAIASFDWSAASHWDKLTGAAAVYGDFGLILGITYLAYRIVCGKPDKLMQENPNDLPRYDARDLDL